MSIAVLNLSNKRIPIIVAKIRGIIIKLTGNSNFPLVNPTLSALTTQVDALDTAYQNALNRGKIEKGIMRAAKKLMMSMMSLLTAYIQNASGGDAVIIQSGGYDVKGPGVAPGILPPPQNVRAEAGNHPGEIIVRNDAVAKRRSYFWQMSANPLDSTSWVNVPNGETGKLKLVIGGLTSATFQWFRVFAMSTDGASGPSDPARGLVP